jgi:histidyl-tRNA synthetase
VKTSPTQVFVGSIKTNNAALLLQERMRICAKLWEAGIRAETSQFLLESIWGIIFIFIGYKANPKLLEQFQFCEQENTQIPWLVMTADEEMAQQSVKLRCVATREETVKIFWSLRNNLYFFSWSN